MVTVKKVPEKMSLTKCPWFLVPEMKCPQNFCPLKNVPMIKCPEDEMSFMTNMVNEGNSPECPFRNVLRRNVLHFLSFRYIYTVKGQKLGDIFERAF